MSVKERCVAAALLFYMAAVSVFLIVDGAPRIDLNALWGCLEIALGTLALVTIAAAIYVFFFWDSSPNPTEAD